MTMKRFYCILKYHKSLQVAEYYNPLKTLFCRQLHTTQCWFLSQRKEHILASAIQANALVNVVVSRFHEQQPASPKPSANLERDWVRGTLFPYFKSLFLSYSKSLGHSDLSFPFPITAYCCERRYSGRRNAT